MKIKDKYGRLSVLKVLPSERVFSKNGNWRNRVNVLCKCECGNEIKVEISRLRSGNTKSCGCFKKELMSKIKSTHHRSRTSEYGIWRKMKERCYKATCKSYRWYGAKGIKVCDRWLKSFDNFLEDMGERPSKKHSIERRDSKKNYTPKNCYWATHDVQIRNTSQVIYVTYNGEKRKLIELAEEFNIKPTIVRDRYIKGRSVEKLFLPKCER